MRIYSDRSVSYGLQGAMLAALLLLSSVSPVWADFNSTVSAFNLDQREQDIQALIAQYGAQYANGSQDLQLIAQIRATIAAAAAATSTSATTLQNQALTQMEQLADRTPAWLYGTLTPVPDRSIPVDSAASFAQAIQNAQPGDEIVIQNGFYQWTLRAAVNGTVPKPIIVRAQSPGGVHFYWDSTIDLSGSNFILQGFVLRESAGSGLRASGVNARATQCVVMGGSDASWFAGSNVRMDHNYWGAGTTRVRRFDLPGAGSNRFGKNILDSDIFGTRRSQPGSDGLADEMMYIATDTDGITQNNPYVHVVNSLIEGWYGEGDMAIKGGIQMFNTTVRDIPNQIIGHNCENTVLSGNYFFSQWVRMPSCTGRQLTNNYFEYSWVVYEDVSESDPVSDLLMSNNTFIDTHYWTRGITGLPAFSGTAINNLAIGLILKDDGYNPTGWTQQGNVTDTAIPALGSGWTVQYTQMQRDSYGVLRAVTPVPYGFQRTDPPYSDYDARIGPSYLPPSVQANRNLISDYEFDADLATGQTSSTAESTWGTVVRPLTLYSKGQPANLHSQAGTGVSGGATDFAFDNSAAGTMGAQGGVAVSTALGIGPSRGFTLLGWINPTQPLGNGAVLFQSGNVMLASPSAGALALSLGNLTVTSPAVYSAVGQWIFFAVTFEGSEAGDEAGGPRQVTFYLASRTQPVQQVFQAPANLATVSMDAISIGANPDGSSAFAGMIDDVRLYAAADSDPYGPGDLLRRGTLAQSDLEVLRQGDIGIFGGTLVPPTVSLTASATTVSAGVGITLTWSSAAAFECTASGNWAGAAPLSGSITVTPTFTGSGVYSLTCIGGGGSTAQDVTVTVSSQSGGGSSTVGSSSTASSTTTSHGGGAIDDLSLLILAALSLRRSRRRLGQPTD